MKVYEEIAAESIANFRRKMHCGLMNIEARLRAACDELKWTPLQLSAFAHKKSTEPARAWLSGRSTPPGDVILALILEEPVFRKHLLGEEAA